MNMTVNNYCKLSAIMGKNDGLNELSSLLLKHVKKKELLLLVSWLELLRMQYLQRRDKMDLIRQTGYAAFEMDAGYRLQGGEQACDYTAAFRSVIGEGSVREITDPEEKKAGLTAILRQSTGRDQWTYGPAMLAAVCVCRLDVETLACKEHL